MTITHSPMGVVHLISSVIAMLLGAYMLWAEKGTPMHKKVGYTYCLSMLSVNITAFGIYHLWGRFGVFHGFALLSLISLLSGMIPIMVRKNAKTIGLHLSFMYWSVIGLYCAFAAEVLVRVPISFLQGRLSAAVFTGTFVVMFLGTLGFKKFKEQWQQRFLKSLEAA
jgi:uncharacterized membrane protein